MSDSRALPTQLREALHDDDKWLRLRWRFGPETLRRACHAVIGELIDEHRVALAAIPAAQLQVWLIGHRRVRDAVEARLLELWTPVRASDPVKEDAPVDWPVWLGRFMDAAANGLRLGEVLTQFGVSRGFVDRVFRTGGVPLPWRQGTAPSVGSPLFQESLKAMRAASGTVRPARRQ